MPAVRESPLWVKAEMRMQKVMSALPLKADINRTTLCPLSANSRHLPRLLDQFVGAANQIKRNVDPERLRGFEVDH